MKTFYSFMLAVCMLSGCTSTQSSGDLAAVPCDSLAGRAVQVDSGVIPLCLPHTGAG